MVEDASNKEYLDRCHWQTLYLLKIIDDLCTYYNINYSISSGTMLGDVREGGFIPWDDDGDIIFTRKEFIKFADALEKEKLPYNVGVYKPREKSTFFDFNYRIYYKEDVLRNDKDCLTSYDGLFSHATVDVFVLDEIPTDKFLNLLFILKQQFVFGLSMSKREVIHYNKYSIIEKIVIFILSSIGRLFSAKDLCDLHDKVSMSCMDKSDTRYYCTSWKPEYPGYQYDKRDFNEFMRIKFEDIELSIIKKYDKILRYDYDDNYMKPKKTHTHDNAFLDTL